MKLGMPSRLHWFLTYQVCAPENSDNMSRLSCTPREQSLPPAEAQYCGSVRDGRVNADPRQALVRICAGSNCYDTPYLGGRSPQELPYMMPFSRMVLDRMLVDLTQNPSIPESPWARRAWDMSQVILTSGR